MVSREEIKQFLKSNILEQDIGEELTYDLDLIKLHILDSLGVLKLVTFLEERNNITIDIHDLDFDKVKSIDGIYNFLLEYDKKK